jgi:hypothetical protein
MGFTVVTGAQVSSISVQLAEPSYVFVHYALKNRKKTLAVVVKAAVLKQGSVKWFKFISRILSQRNDQSEPISSLFEFISDYLSLFSSDYVETMLFLDTKSLKMAS